MNHKCSISHLIYWAPVMRREADLTVCGLFCHDDSYYFRCVVSYQIMSWIHSFKWAHLYLKRIMEMNTKQRRRQPSDVHRGSRASVSQQSHLNIRAVIILNALQTQMTRTVPEPLQHLLSLLSFMLWLQKSHSFSFLMWTFHTVTRHLFAIEVNCGNIWLVASRTS